MRNSENLFESLNWGLIRLLPDMLDDGDGKGARASVVIRFMFILLIILILIGDEAVKLMFRNNFGTKGVNGWKAFACVLCFIGIGILTWTLFSDKNAHIDEIYGSRSSFFFTGLLYFFLSVYILFKAFIARRNRNIEPLYRGDSAMLSFLINKGISPSKVQNFYEPFTLISVGALLSAYNIFAGVPLMFCACSVWVTYGIEAMLGVSHVRDALAKHGYQNHATNEFSNVS